MNEWLDFFFYGKLVGKYLYRSSHGASGYGRFEGFPENNSVLFGLVSYNDP